MSTDDKIRAILRMEADAVDPSAAGFDAIRSGIATRRRRAWWVRGGALAGAALTVAAVAVVASGGNGAPHGIDQARPSVSTSPSATPTATPPAAGPATPVGAIWPLTTRGEVDGWLADRSAYPSLATTGGSALAFARNYLGIADATVAQVPGEHDSQTWEVRRPGSSRVVSSLDVRGFGDASSAPYLVTVATSEWLRMTAPGLDATVTSPLHAHGTYTDVDPGISVVVRADAARAAPAGLGTSPAVTGPPDVWDATVSFTTRAHTGSVLVVNRDNRDGGLTAAYAVPVTFGPATTPATFVAARDGRVAVLSVATGKVVRWLTAATPGGGAYDPRLTPDGKTVVYAQGAGTCSSAIRSVPVAGGVPATLVAAGSAALAGPSRDGDVDAYVRTTCRPRPKDEVVMVNPGGPVVEPVRGGVAGGVTVVGGRFVVYVTRDGGTTFLHSADANGEFADVPTAPPAGCAWQAATGAESPDGPRVLAAARCSGDTRLYRYDIDLQHRTPAGRIGAVDVTSLDRTPTADDLLVGVVDGAGEDEAFVWRAGALTRVPGVAQRPSWA
jgi:hypothetical protein